MTNNRLLSLLLLMTTAFFIVLILVSLVFSRRSLNTQQLENVTVAPVYKNHDISTTFRSQKDNLSTIFILLKNVNLRNKDPFLISLKNDVTVRKINISGLNIGDDEWVRIQFEPIKEAKNKDFTLTLQSETEGTASAIQATQSFTGQLVYKIYSQDSPAKAIKNIMDDFSKRFFEDLGFAVVYISLLVLSIYWYIKNRLSF